MPIGKGALEADFLSFLATLAGSDGLFQLGRRAGRHAMAP
jgi:hypothetical protein